jgi:hypothetical protein
VASDDANGTSRILASVRANRVFPEPVGPLQQAIKSIWLPGAGNPDLSTHSIRTLLFSNSISSSTSSNWNAGALCLSVVSLQPFDVRDVASILPVSCSPLTVCAKAPESRPSKLVGRGAVLSGWEGRSAEKVGV